MNANSGLRLEDFVIIKEIGKGGFGTVSEAVHKGKGWNGSKKVALKKMTVDSYNDEKLILSEISILQRATHNNIVKMFGHFKCGKDYYIVLELCEHGSIRNYVKQNGPLSDEASAYILHQLVCAVRYLHNNKFMHRDLSSGNVLISRRDMKENIKHNVKICDFGLAREVRRGENAVTMVGTPGYIAPQVMLDAPYSNKVDVYSLGGVLHTMLTGTDPPPKGPLHLHRVSPLGRDLIHQMMDMNERTRIALLDVQKSAFMQANLRGDDALYSFTSRDNSTDRRLAVREAFSSRVLRSLDNDRQTYSRQDSEKIPVRRRASQPAPINRQIMEPRDTWAASCESRQPAGSDMLSSITRLAEGSWMLCFDKCSGMRFRTQNTRCVVDSSGHSVQLEIVDSSATVRQIVVAQMIGAKQEIVVGNPLRQRVPLPKDEAPLLSMDRATARGPYRSLEAMRRSPDSEYFNRLQHAVDKLRGQIDRLSYRRPNGFAWARVKLMDNGDFRMIEDVHQGSKIPSTHSFDKAVRKAREKRIRWYQRGVEISINDPKLYDSVERLYAFLTGIEAIVKNAGERFPLVLSGSLGISAPNVGESRVIASELQVKPHTMQQRCTTAHSTASAPANLHSRPILRERQFGQERGRAGERQERNESSRLPPETSRASRSVRNFDDDGMALKSKDGIVLGVEARDGRTLRRSTAQTDVFIFRSTAGAKEMRFLIGDAPREAEALLNRLVPHLGDRVRS